ncbi:hypothetical protein HanRHA438_Chr16g0756751 [Helianthus annuus]|nr:hypothetical protein HanRHA438_Chr16g0756751 [Helianthus annuus]
MTWPEVAIQTPNLSENTRTLHHRAVEIKKKMIVKCIIGYTMLSFNKATGHSLLQSNLLIKISNHKQ